MSTKSKGWGVLLFDSVDNNKKIQSYKQER